MSIEIDANSRRVLLKLQDMDRAIRLGTRRGLWGIGKQLRDTARKGLKRGKRTGRIYKFRGKPLRSSAPHEWAQRRTGILRQGVGFHVDGDFNLEFGDTAKYAVFVELKDPMSGGRPYLIRSIKKNRDKIERIMYQDINKEIGI